MEINHGITWEGERKVEKRREGKEKNRKRGTSRDKGQTCLVLKCFIPKLSATVGGGTTTKETTQSFEV